jgi:hypothetical protein
MAITIVATAGGASSNSYLTLADAQLIVDGFVQDADITAWATATTDQKNRALFTATQRLDRERFLGARSTDTQALQWPRTGVRKPDTYINTYATGFPFRISTDYFTDVEIPQQIQYAQVVLAVYLHNNPDGIGLSGLEDFKNVQIGSLNVTPNLGYGAVGADKIPPIVERYLTGIRIRYGCPYRQVWRDCGIRGFSDSKPNGFGLYR